jgi:hypothetical protein
MLVALAGCVLSCAAGAAARDGGRKTASYCGVSFSYDGTLAAEPRGETVPASPLEDPTFKPGGNVPEHVAFKFVGPYASRSSESHFNPEIHVYPVEAYKRAYAVAPQYAEAIGRTVRDLKHALARRPASFKDEAPFIDYVDAHQAFQARVRYLNFRGGRGLAFLTQYVFELTPITNRGLTYVFQGLTDDGRFYVSATFPVAAPGLPGDDPPELLRELYDNICATCPDYGAHNRAYVRRVRRMLERTPPRRFKPSLTALDSLLTSLRVSIGEHR